MVKQRIVTLLDDVDGGTATQTVRFGLDGKSYEIDLNDEHAAQMRAGLERFVAAGRKVPVTQRRKPAAGRSIDPKAVRAWASSNGITVSSRGRIPAHVVDQFVAAGN